MFDMLLESGHRTSIVPSWGKGVAITLHLLVLSALWHAPASPAHASKIGIVLPPFEPLPSPHNGGPNPPVLVCKCPTFPLPVPPIEPVTISTGTLTAPVMTGPGPETPIGTALFGDSNPVLSTLVQEPPELLTAPAPVYPVLLVTAGIQGRVIVAAVVDTLGRTESGSVRIVASDNAGFDRAALQTVRDARFRPGRMYGRAVRVLVQVPVVFRLY